MENPTPDTGETRVLVVDDEPGLADLTKVFVERENAIAVTTENSAEAALRRLADEQFDCIVSDFRMPETNGLEFLASVRDELDLRTPFIIFTGNSREDVAIDALNLGANRYIRKGGSPKAQFGVLGDAIRKEVAHYRSVQTTKAYEERLELAQEIADFGIIDWDLTTDEVFCSDGLCEMFGLPSGDRLAIEDLQSVMHPDDRDRIERALSDAIAGESEYRISHRIVRPDGEVVWTKNQARLMRNDRGEPTRLLGIAVDVTAEKTAPSVETN